MEPDLSHGKHVLDPLSCLPCGPCGYFEEEGGPWRRPRSQNQHSHSLSCSFHPDTPVPLGPQQIFLLLQRSLLGIEAQGPQAKAAQSRQCQGVSSQAWRPGQAGKPAGSGRPLPALLPAWPCCHWGSIAPQQRGCFLRHPCPGGRHWPQPLGHINF